MTKQFDFNWRRPVCESLQNGEIFDRIEEDGSVIEPGCLVRVDEHGFFIYWTSDGREGQVIECSQISDIRFDTIIKPNGYNSSQTNGENESKVVCICSGLDFVNINYTYFLAKSVTTAASWLTRLRSITHNYKSNNVCAWTQLQKHWLKLCLMVNSEGKIPVRSITRTFASGRTEKMVMQSLEDIGFPGGKNEAIERKNFTFEKFMDLYHKICPRTDIEDLFAEISYHKNHITASQLMDFMNDVQRDPRLNEILCPFYDRPRVLQLINRYEEDQSFIQREWLSKTGFVRYLMSDENAPVFLDRLDIYQEMDHPLSHYYINSSHNTYLIGRQFGGKSSVEMYRQVLIAGCRCIELDCWDGPGNEPVITHGKAMCTDINFKDVIQAIKETAFVASDYPVILSFENHCTKHQQYLLAKYCEDLFGDMLLKDALPDLPLKPGVPLPSPNQLKRKILIKNKRLKPEVEKEQLERFLKGERSVVETIDTSSNVEGEDDQSEISEDENANMPTLPELAHPEQNSPVIDLLVSESKFLEMKEKHDAEKTDKIALNLVGKSDSINTDDEAQLINNYRYTSATTNIHPYLSSLVNYVQPVKFQGFDIAEDRQVNHNMSSFNENTGLGLLKNHATEFVNYNKRQLSRIYPRGSRVDSSNYMPQIFWNAGCQMVSLNFQTPDLAMQLNQGKFEYNGNCGYLLKPDFMRRPDREFDPFSECPVDGVIAAQCSVQVISGQFLSDKRVGTYVEVDMFGLPTDTIKKEFRTKVIPSNGLNPLYGSEPFVFRKIVLPDLAILRIAVYEESGKLIGQRILPLDGLQAGYRHISLRTEGNFPLSLPTVFCKIVLKTYIPRGFDQIVDALSDPRRFLSMAEKRAEQMKNMGIDESDIEDVPEMSHKSKQKAALSTTNSVGIFAITSQPSVKINNNQKEIEVKFEQVNIDTLKESRAFCKITRQHSKEVSVMKKRHEKDKLTARKLHSANNSSMDDKSKKSLKKKGVPKSMSDGEFAHLDKEFEASPIWKAMSAKHAAEDMQVKQNHLEKQYHVLKQLLSAAHDAQCKETLAKQDREKKELTASQTKLSLNTRKQFNTDKAIKSKAEADRRMKEITENNAKRFGEERVQLQDKHRRQIEILKANQEKEQDRLTHLFDEERAQLSHDPEILEKVETVI